MTKKAMKYQFVRQLKAAMCFIVMFFIVMCILAVVFYYNNAIVGNWVSISTIYSPKIYLLVMGIVYPLITMELYISRGLTRKQYFWTLTASISIISLILIIPAIIFQIMASSLSPMFALINLVQMPAFFLMGWTAVVGFQHGIWYKAPLGILCAITTGHIMNTIPELYKLPELASLGISLALLVLQIIVLPRFIKRIPIKI